MVATLIILALAVAGFVSGRVPVGVVAVGVAVSLWLTGVLDLGQALAGFGDPTVVFIAALFVVSESLDATGVTAWAGSQVIRRAGTARAVLLTVICVLVAVVTAFISVNGAVAALIPMVVVVAMRAKIPVSQMLLPLAFSAHAGSLLALTGSPVNIIVSEQAYAAGGRPFGFFEYALVGLPLLVGSLAVTLLLGRFLLPMRSPAGLPTDLSAHTLTLRTQYELPAGRPLAGRRRGIAEVIVTPRSSLVGLHLFTGMSTPSGDLVVIGLQRGGVDLEGTRSTLQPGDTLLLSGSWDDLDRHTAGPDVVVVTPPSELRRGVPLGAGAKRSIAVLLAMVVLLASGILPAAIAGLLAASALIVLRVVSPAQAYRSISCDLRPHDAAGPVDLQHGDSANRRSRCAGRRGRPESVGVAVHDGARGRGRGVLPDAGGDACQHDGDGAGRLPLRGLLEARSSLADSVSPGGRVLGAGAAAVLRNPQLGG